MSRTGPPGPWGCSKSVRKRKIRWTVSGQEWPRQTKPKKGQSWTFRRGIPERKFPMWIVLVFLRKKHQNSQKMGKIHELPWFGPFFGLVCWGGPNQRKASSWTFRRGIPEQKFQMWIVLVFIRRNIRIHKNGQNSWTSLKTLTSLNKESRPFFLGDNSIRSLPFVSSLSAITASGGPECYFSLVIIAFGAFGFIVPKY